MVLESNFDYKEAFLKFINLVKPYFNRSDLTGMPLFN